MSLLHTETGSFVSLELFLGIFEDLGVIEEIFFFSLSHCYVQSLEFIYFG